MQTVDIYIGTSIRGPRKGTGRVMYLMRGKKKSGKNHEIAPEVAEFEDVTESRLVLYGIKDSLQRFNYACSIVIHTESGYVASAINRHWIERWRQQGWVNSHGEPVKDAELWDEIYRNLEENGHEIRAEQGKHEFTYWMAWRMPVVRVNKLNFLQVPKE